MDINSYLLYNGVNEIEGHSQNIEGQTNRLKELVSQSSIKNIFEIGFNAGHSADTFLKSNKNCNVVSCDLNIRNCVLYGKQFIDKTYPQRHTLLLGDSKDIIPEYIKNNPNVKYDIIFIDGGHDYDTAKADIINCKKLAHNDTIVIVDDISNYLLSFCTWAVEPTRVWKEMVENKFIQELSHEDYAIGRGMSWGKYIF